MSSMKGSVSAPASPARGAVAYGGASYQNPQQQKITFLMAAPFSPGRPRTPGRARCRRTLLIPASFGRNRKGEAAAGASASEPSSPKVTCMGRVRHRQGCSRTQKFQRLCALLRNIHMVCTMRSVASSSSGSESESPRR